LLALVPAYYTIFGGGSGELALHGQGKAANRGRSVTVKYNSIMCSRSFVIVIKIKLSSLSCAIRSFSSELVPFSS